MLNRIRDWLNRPTSERLDIMAASLDALTAAVAKAVSVEESAITLIAGLKAQLDAAIASNDPAQLQALSDSLGAENSKLAAAVGAGEPAPAPPATAPEPTPAPPVAG